MILKVPKSFVVASGVIMAFLYVPVCILIVLSFNASTLGSVWKGFSMRWYEVLIQDWRMWEAAGNSLLIAVLSTACSLGLGLGAALVLERSQRRTMSWINTVMILPLVVPEILLGVALLMVFVLFQVQLGFFTIVVGHMVFNLPLTIFIIRARLQKLNPIWEDAARDLGARSGDVLKRIILPHLRPAIWGAALLSFTVSLDDFVVTFFVAGPGTTTLPLKVFSMIKTGITPEINALSTILVLISMALVGVSWLLLGKDPSTTTR